MSDNFFAQDEEEEFRDIPDEVIEGQSAPAVSVKVTKSASTQPPAPVAQKQVAPPPALSPAALSDQDVDEDEDDFSSVINDARLRLEQGRLYEMIMNHSLFEGLDADEKAIKFVQKQIRNFAKEQMEIMLGMRPEPSKEPVLALESVFNDLEVETLKALASAATKGATQTAEAQLFSGRREGLNPIGVATVRPQIRPIGTAPVRAKTTKPLAKPVPPLLRGKNQEVVEQILAEEGVSKEELLTTFDPGYKPLEKPLHQMTEDELRERNRQIKQRTTSQVKSTGALPFPTPEQEEMMYTARANQAAAHPQMQSILNLLNQPKKK